jgi:hypothetical protein
VQYELIFRPKAVRDLERLSPEIARRIERKLELLCQDLSGDVKRLVDFTPGLAIACGRLAGAVPAGTDASGCASDRSSFLSV